MTTDHVAPAPSARTHLIEHCGCTDGMVRRGAFLEICRDCKGTQRRLRGTHDPRSSIDFDPNASPLDDVVIGLASKLERARELARVLRDPTNSAPLTELLDLLEGLTHG